MKTSVLERLVTLKISIRGKVLERRLPDDVMGKTAAKSLRPDGEVGVGGISKSDFLGGKNTKSSKVCSWEIWKIYLVPVQKCI